MVFFLPKLFCSTVRKEKSCDREKVLKFEPDVLRSTGQLIQTVKGKNNFWSRIFV